MVQVIGGFNHDRAPWGYSIKHVAFYMFSLLGDGYIVVELWIFCLEGEKHEASWANLFFFLSGTQEE